MDRWHGVTCTRKTEVERVKTVSREELYEQVWSRPMTKVAADYGVTGTALKRPAIATTFQHRNADTGPNSNTASRSKKESLPPLTEPNLAVVRVTGSPEQHLSQKVREA